MTAIAKGRAARAVTALLLAVSLLPLFPETAGGWANGIGGCNSFGTHDRILAEAVEAAGAAAAWVRVRTALRATDDPDCVDGIDHASGTWWHVYDEWGSRYGGAPEAAGVWFRRMKRRLAEGRRRSASRALGYLAHVVGDVAQPMHTDQRDREERVHSSYEDAVDRRVADYTFSYDGRDRARAKRRTLRLARGAHRFYLDLVDSYDERGYDGTVHRITRRQLNRAMNAMADLLTSV